MAGREGRHETAASGFFARRLETFPRLATYRLAQQEGVFPYYKTVASASTPRFTIEGREPTHVGLVIGSEEFIHAPGTGGVVRVERFTTPYWASRFTEARRMAM